VVVVASAGNVSPAGGKHGAGAAADPEAEGGPEPRSWLTAPAVATGMTSPGTSQRIITVGALDTRKAADPGDDGPAPFSPQGPGIGGRAGPDCLAPGIDVVSLLAPSSETAERVGTPPSLGGYVTMSGTSVAAAVVSGVCAVLTAAHPGLDPDGLKKALLDSAMPTGAGRRREGAGRVRPYWAAVSLGFDPGAGSRSDRCGGGDSGRVSPRARGNRRGQHGRPGGPPGGILRRLAGGLQSHPVLLHPFGSRPLGPAHPYLAGPDVAVLKVRLGVHDRFACGRPDPEFDLETERALRRFQKAYGLPVTGRCRCDDFMCLGEVAWYDRPLQGFGRRPLAGGDAGDDVFVLQARLALCGLAGPKPPSGVLRREEALHLKRYQEAAGISPANGVARADTFLALAADTPLGGRVLAAGDCGTDVYCLQRLLNTLEGQEVCPESGSFDLATREAVRKFRAQEGLEPTGVVDFHVWWLLGRRLHG